MFIEKWNSKKSIWNAPARNQQKQTRQAKAHKYDHISTLSIPIICSITKENDFVIHKSIFLKGGLLDQQTVDFFLKQILSLFSFVMRNLSKRPEISWKTKRQKRSLVLCENASLKFSSKSVFFKFFWWKRFSTCLMFGGF